MLPWSLHMIACFDEPIGNLAKLLTQKSVRNRSASGPRRT